MSFREPQTPGIIFGADPFTTAEVNTLLALITNGANFSDDEIPSGTINSSNTSFTLAQTTVVAASIILVLQGQLQLQGSDYTVSGHTITYASAPPTSSWHRAWYRYT